MTPEKKQETKKQDYDELTLNIDELLAQDFKLTPEVYIHNALSKAQHALTNPDVQTGFLQFRVLIENAEIICSAGKLTPPDYEEQLKAFMEAGYKEAPEDVREIRLANHKLKLLLGEVFHKKTRTTPMKLGKSS